MIQKQKHIIHLFSIFFFCLLFFAKMIQLQLMHLSFSINKERKLNQNQLLRYSNLNPIQQIGSYYNHNKDLLPPILQSRRFFIQQIQNKSLDRRDKILQEVLSPENKEQKQQKQIKSVRSTQNKEQFSDNALIELKPKIGLIIFDKNHRRKIKRQSFLLESFYQKNGTNLKNGNQQSFLEKVVSQHFSKSLIKKPNAIKQNKCSLVCILEKMQNQPNMDMIHNRKTSNRFTSPVSLIFRNNLSIKSKDPLNETLNCKKCLKYDQNTRQTTEIKKIITKQSPRDQYIKTSEGQFQKPYVMTQVPHLKNQRMPKKKQQQNDIKSVQGIPSFDEALQPWNEEQNQHFDYSRYIYKKKSDQYS